MNKIYGEKTKLFKDSIINTIGDYSKTQIGIIKKITNTTNLNEGFSEIVNDINNMKNAMGELKKEMEKEPITKLKVKFLKDVVENELSKTKCKYINIDDIKIENIGGETLKNLYFMRDEKESSKDFIISQSKNINNHKLTSTGDDFIPGRTEKHSITLTINNPKVDQTYNMYLYVKENEDGEIISKPLKIVYKIKEDQEPVIKNEPINKDNVNINNEPVVNVVNGDVNINNEPVNIENVNLNNEPINNDKLNINNEPVVNVVNGDVNNNNEPVDIENFNSNIEPINNDKVNVDNKPIVNVVNGDGDVNNNNDPDSNGNVDPNIEPINDIDQNEVDKIFNDLEVEFNLSSILGREVIIDKIIELKCDRKKIYVWVDEVL